MYYYLQEQNFKNDFNYPSLNRKDLMSLDTIKEKDFPKKKINQINSKRNWSINLYNLDIDKSYPKRNDLFLNKVDFINKIDDIEKARPNKEKILIKPNFILNVRDIEKAYPKKERKFHDKNYFNKSIENKLLTPQYSSQKNYNNIYNNYNNLLKNNFNNRYENENKSSERNAFNNNLYIINSYKDNNKYNNEEKDKLISNKNNAYNRNNKINNEIDNNRRLLNSTKNILTIPLDTHLIIRNQKDYKDTIQDVFNNYPEYINNTKPDNYILNHHHDLIIGTPNKNNRLDNILDKSNKILSYDFSQKININDSKRNNYDILNSPNSIKINRRIPPEIKKQGLEKLYKELDNYKPKTYEQHLDLFTQNY